LKGEGDFEEKLKRRTKTVCLLKTRLVQLFIYCGQEESNCLLTEDKKDKKKPTVYLLRTRRIQLLTVDKKENNRAVSSAGDIVSY